jgi:hypothetical protein
MRKSRHTYSLDQLQEAVNDSVSVAQVLKKLNLNIYGSAYDTVKKRIKENNIDTSHFTGQLWSKGKIVGPKPRIKLEDILSNKVEYSNNHLLKQRLINEGYFERKCYECNRDTWNNQPIPIELEHKDGNHKNNSIENLTILCPNCHAQTDTHAGKNIKLKK